MAVYTTANGVYEKKENLEESCGARRSIAVSSAHMATLNVGTVHLGIKITAHNQRKGLGIEHRWPAYRRGKGRREKYRDFCWRSGRASRAVARYGGENPSGTAKYKKYIRVAYLTVVLQPFLPLSSSRVHTVSCASLPNLSLSFVSGPGARSREHNILSK